MVTQAALQLDAGPAGGVRPLGFSLELLRIVREDAAAGRLPAGYASAEEPYIPEGEDVLLDSMLSDWSYFTHLRGVFDTNSDWADVKPVGTGEAMLPKQVITQKAFTEASWQTASSAGGAVVLLLALLSRWRTHSGLRPAKRWRLAALAALPLVVLAVFAFPPQGTVVVQDRLLQSARNQQLTMEAQWRLWLNRLGRGGVAG